MTLFFAGLAAGLSMAVSLGPSYLYMIQMALRNGLRASLMVASGIMLCDLLFISIALKGVGTLYLSNNNQQWVGLGGGLMLVIMGSNDLIKASRTVPAAVLVTSELKPWKLFTKGLMLNATNPFNFIFWIGVVGMVSGKVHYTMQRVVFMAGFVATVAISTWLKCYLPAKLGKRLNQTYIKRFNQIAGLVFVASGIYLLAMFALTY